VSNFIICNYYLNLNKCEKILNIYEQGRVFEAFDFGWALGQWFQGIAWQSGWCWDFFLYYLWFEVWKYF
jgi:hypothetical protein